MIPVVYNNLKYCIILILSTVSFQPLAETSSMKSVSSDYYSFLIPETWITDKQIDIFNNVYEMENKQYKVYNNTWVYPVNHNDLTDTATLSINSFERIDGDAISHTEIDEFIKMPFREHTDYDILEETYESPVKKRIVTRKKAYLTNSVIKQTNIHLIILKDGMIHIFHLSMQDYIYDKNKQIVKEIINSFK